MCVCVCGLQAASVGCLNKQNFSTDVFHSLLLPTNWLNLQICLAEFSLHPREGILNHETSPIIGCLLGDSSQETHPQMAGCVPNLKKPNSPNKIIASFQARIVFINIFFPKYFHPALSTLLVCMALCDFVHICER